LNLRRRSFVPALMTHWFSRTQLILTRLAPGRSRARRAIVVGAVFGALGGAMLDLNATVGAAQDFFDAIFGGGPRYSVSPYDHQSGHYRQRRPHSYYGWRRAHMRRFSTAHVHRHGSDESAPFGDAFDGPRTVCLRSCDGYIFPLGGYTGKSNIAQQEAACRSLCPNAKIKLYIAPRGSEKITNARDVAPMSEAPASTQLGQSRACSCYGAATDEQRVRALLTDRTLRKGDSVMTLAGLKIFRGAKHYPFTYNDFVSLKASRGVRREARGLLAAIEKAEPGGRPRPENAANEIPGPPPLSGRGWEATAGDAAIK
jgi:hypothetical protein